MAVSVREQQFSGLLGNDTLLFSPALTGVYPHLGWNFSSPGLEPQLTWAGTSAHLGWNLSSPGLEPQLTWAGTSAHLGWNLSSPGLEPQLTWAGTSAHLDWNLSSPGLEEDLGGLQGLSAQLDLVELGRGAGSGRRTAGQVRSQLTETSLDLGQLLSIRLRVTVTAVL